jgi:hypothetical protein
MRSFTDEETPTWEDYKEVEKELDEAYIGYATSATPYERMSYACAIECYHKALMLMKAEINVREGNCETIKCGMCCI